MVLRVARLGNAGIFNVTANSEIRVVGGLIVHKTGTISALRIHDTRGASGDWLIILAQIAAATANANFYLYDDVKTNLVYQTDLSHFWIPEGWSLYFSGDAAAYCRIIYELRTAKRKSS